ncbi:recombinase RecT [Sorangium sp. So ce1024]|uniref:recombinase RecT n=1 Tax=Sorangium sp. So ce1024 TaxID=3133327 RepID=UPI003F100AE8
MAGMQRAANGHARGVEGRPQAQAMERAPEDHLKQVLFVERRKELEALFPQDGKAIVNRMASVAVSQFRKLAAMSQYPVDIPSLVDSITHAAQLGLEIIGDQAYLVPYKGKIQLIVGPGGLITLGHREGIAVCARCVFAGDDFDYDLGANWVRHKKAEKRRVSRDPWDDITHAWAKITRAPVVPGAQPVETIEVLTKEDLAYYRSFSKADKGPWIDNPEGMCRKTAIKRVYAFAPKGYVLSSALQEDDHGAFVPPVIIDAEEPRRGAVSASVPEQVTNDASAGAGAPQGPRQAPPSDRGNGQRRPGPRVDPAVFSFKFGREKGIALVQVQDLDFYEKATRGSIDDPEKARFRAENAAILEAIHAEQARRRGEVPSDQEPGQAEDFDDRGDDPNNY